MDQLSVREITTADIPFIKNYWLSAAHSFLEGMGVDVSKMPSEEEWTGMLQAQIGKNYFEKQSYCLIWEVDGLPVGHSNVNQIKFGEEAAMHLHLWYPEKRKKGIGPQLVRLGLPLFFRNLQLQKVYSEPYALNPAPGRALEKAGFVFSKKYRTTPGWINFEQEVNRWEMTRERFEKITATF
jgi:RimJ/RimL family protein N-acetyltransferase